MLARNVTSAASSGTRTTSYTDVRARDRWGPASGVIGGAIRRTAIVAAGIAMLGGSAVTVAAHDASPGSALYPFRQAGHAVVSLFSGGAPVGDASHPRASGCDHATESELDRDRGCGNDGHTRGKGRFDEHHENRGNSGNAPGRSGDAPGRSGDAPGHNKGSSDGSDDRPGRSGDAPGHNEDSPDDLPGRGSENRSERSRGNGPKPKS
jgi:hypothetical protein